MTPDQITQLRRLLKESLADFQKLAMSKFANKAVSKVQQALALLPCPTCNGTSKVPTAQSIGFGKENEILDSCPDCK